MGDITQTKRLTLELGQAVSDSGSIDRAEQCKHVPPHIPSTSSKKVRALTFTIILDAMLRTLAQPALKRSLGLEPPNARVSPVEILGRLQFSEVLVP